MPIRDWSTLNDETNGDSDIASGISWVEQMQSSQANNSSRAEMAETRKWYDDISAIADSTGTGTAYAVTTSQAIVSPLQRGDAVILKAHTTNTNACTLNVNGIGGVAWQARPGVELAAGQIQAGQIVGAYFDGVRFLALNLDNGIVTVDQLEGNTRGLLKYVSAIEPWFGEEAAIPDGYLLCNGQSVSRSSYAQLFAIWGTMFGAVDGNSFNIVDLRGQTLRGLDVTGAFDPDVALRTAADKTATVVGGVPGSRQGHAMQVHTHDGPAGQLFVTDQVGGGINSGSTDNAKTLRAATGGVTPAVPVGQETRGKNVAPNWIVLADAAAAGAEATYVAGLSGLRFVFKDDQDTSVDPGIGRFTINTTDLDSFTEIALDDQTADTGNPDVRSVIDTWGVPIGTNKGTLKLSRSAGPEVFVQATLTATNGQSGFTRLTVPGTGLKDGWNGVFVDGESVSIDFFKATPGSAGNPGADGVDGGAPWDFSTNIDTLSDPGPGEFRINAARDEIAISGTNSGGGNSIEWLRTWDNSTTGADRGIVDVKLRSSSSDNFQQLRINGPITADNTTWLRLPFEDVGAPVGTIGNGDDCSIQFARTGNEGGATGGEANTSTDVGTGVGISLTKSGVDLPKRSLLNLAGQPVTAAASGGGNEVELAFDIIGRVTTQGGVIDDDDNVIVQKTPASPIMLRRVPWLDAVNNLITRVNTWKAGQATTVTETATWTSAWDTASSNDFNITATVSGAAGDMPVGASAHLGNGSAQVGVITFTTAAGNTAGFAAQWEIGENVSIDVSTAGGYEATYRVWRDSGGTTRYRINGITRFIP